MAIDGWAHFTDFHFTCMYIVIIECNTVLYILTHWKLLSNSYTHISCLQDLLHTRDLLWPNSDWVPKFVGSGILPNLGRDVTGLPADPPASDEGCHCCYPTHNTCFSQLWDFLCNRTCHASQAVQLHLCHLWLGQGSVITVSVTDNLPELF